MRTRWTRAVFAAGALASAGGCGGRADIWEQPIADGARVQGLAGAVAIVDEPAHRVVLVWASAGQTIGTASVPVGHEIGRAHV
jgi:hypothetical protein